MVGGGGGGEPPVRAEYDDETRTRNDGPGGQRREPPARVKLAPTLGRYTVLDRLGSGGMGQVLAAYDPKLDRRVALKLLHAHGTAVDAERLAREAKALALVSHPNVVTIHEVDELDGQLAIAMEFVPGQTLYQWMVANWDELDARTRGQRALKLLRQASSGLGAAHNKGLVHRDFKPANVLVGEDGRVRVADFGLARRVGGEAPLSGGTPSRGTSVDVERSPELTEEGMVVGTRAYMAPEQLAGERADDRSDQYSFCVVAWEVLFGSRPKVGAGPQFKPSIPAPAPDRKAKLPRHIEDALRKGLARDPAARHVSMDTLTELLETDAEAGNSGVRRRRPWRQLALGAAVIGAIVGGRAIHQFGQRKSCEEEAQRIHGAWNDQVQSKVADGLLGTGASYAQSTVDRVPFWLNKYAASWHDSMRDACIATRVDHTWSLETFDRAQWCLEERRIGFESLIDSFLHADTNIVRTAITEVADLEGPKPCVDEEWLRLSNEPPSLPGRYASLVTWADMGLSSRLMRMRDSDAAVEAASRARVRAEQTGWLPLLAAAQLREGEILSQAGRPTEAEAALRESYRTSVAAGQWISATNSAAALTTVAGLDLGRPEIGALWLDQARTMNGRTIDLFGLRERILTDRQGRLHALRGNLAESIPSFQAALGHARAVYGERHPQVAVALQHLGNGFGGAGRFSEGVVAYQEALEIMESVLGEEHPSLAGPLLGIAATMHQLHRDSEARPLATRAIRLLEEEHGPDHPQVGAALNTLASILAPLGEDALAENQLIRSLSIQERVTRSAQPMYSTTLNTLANLYADRGDTALAEATLERAIRSVEKSLGPTSPRLVPLLNNFGAGKLEAKAYAEAMPVFQRSLSIANADLGPSSMSVLWAYVGLGSAAVGLKDLDTAHEALEAALAQLVVSQAPPSLEVTQLEAEVGRLLWDTAKGRNAEDSRRDAHALMTHAAATFDVLGAAESHEAAAQWLLEHPVRPARK